jgi:hypothetical protein
MFMVTTASEQELSAAMDRTAEAAIDFMTARGKDLGGEGDVERWIFYAVLLEAEAYESPRTAQQGARGA